MLPLGTQVYWRAQISRVLQTQKNAILGADATAHNELVFHNGRTRQCVTRSMFLTMRRAAAGLHNTVPHGRSGTAIEKRLRPTLQLSLRLFGARAVGLRYCKLIKVLPFKKLESGARLRGIKVIPAGIKCPCEAGERAAGTPSESYYKV